MPSPQDEPRLAVLVGINSYNNGIPPLSGAVDDVLVVADVLQKLHGYQIRLLLDKEATADGIRRLFVALRTEVSERHRVVFYFAGHGIAEAVADSQSEKDAAKSGPQGLLLPQDADPQRPSSFLPMFELQEALEGLRCHHLLIVLDCCFSGAFRWQRTRSLDVQLGSTLFLERYQRYLRDPARQVLTSCAHDERALDTIQRSSFFSDRGQLNRQSPFAQALCEGLRGKADMRTGGHDADGIILPSELYLYIENEMARLEAQRRQRRLQRPMLWSLEGHEKGQFIFWTPGRKPLLPTALPSIEENNPYRGLEVYEETHQELFFGRQEATERITATVMKQPLVVVVGASGTGKSSLVRAGLLSQLRAQTQPAWVLMAPLRPGSRPLSGLAQLAQQIAPGSKDLAAAVRAFRTRHPDQKLLVVIDQLEELVTVGKAEHAQFLNELQGARNAGGAQLHIVATLRSDFEPHFTDLLASGSGESPRFLVPHMSYEDLRQAIEGPASQRVLFFEPPGLVGRLVDEVIDMPGALPLLSFTLSEMYRTYAKRHAEGEQDRTLTESDYKALGEVAGALSRRAEEVYQSLDAAAQQTLRYLMLRMVVPGEPARRRVYQSELVFPDSEQRRVEIVKQMLLDARLIVSDRDDDNNLYIEPAHDKLVLGWQWLEQLRAEDLGHRLHHNLIDAVQIWEQSSHVSAYLWDRDPQLPQALAILRDQPARFNSRETRLLKDSRRRRRSKQMLVAVAIVAVIAGLGVWLNRERDNADELRQQLLNTYVEMGRQLLFDKQNPNEALLWLYRAQGSGSNHPSLPDLLKSARQSMGVGNKVLQHGSRVRVAAYSPDSRHIVTASEDETARVWDADTGKLSATLKGHRGVVSSATYSPDGRHIVTASWDHTARVWDADTGQLQLELKGHRNLVHSATYSPDGHHIVTASWDNSARVWNADTGDLFAELKGHWDNVKSATYSLDGRRIVTASWDRTARVWDAKTGMLLAELKGHGGRVHSVAYSPDGRRIVTASQDETARVWDAETGKLLAELKGHGDQVLSATYDRYGHRIATASADKTARVWDAETGKLLATLKGHWDSVQGATYSPDGRRIVTASQDGTASVWDAETGKLLAELQGHRDNVESATYSPNGRYIVTASWDKTARVWQAETGKLLAELGGQEGSLHRAVYSPDGLRIFTVSDDMRTWVWDAEKGSLLTELRGGGIRLQSTAYSPDSRRIITVGGDDTGRLWDAEKGTLLAELKDHEIQIEIVVYSPDGRRIVTAGKDRTVRIWNAETAKLLAELKGHEDRILSATYSPDSRHIVTASEDHTTRVWDAGTGKLVAKLKGHEGSVHSATYSPDGRRIVTASADQTARVWEADTGKLLAELKGHRATVWNATFSPDGRCVVTASWDKTARVWEADTGKLITEFKGPGRLVNSAAYSPDSRRIVTAGSDGIARVWEADTGKLLAELKGHGASIESAMYSPDGRRIVSASKDETALVWDIAQERPYVSKLTEFIRCHVPLRFESEDSDVIVGSLPDPAECQGDAKPLR